MNFRSFLFLTIFLISFGVSAATASKSSVAPPDTTTKLIDKSTAIYMMEEGKRMFSEGKVKDALAQFRQAALKDPNSWRPPYWIAQCHYAMSNYGFALKYSNDAMKINAVDIDDEIYELYGKVYHRMGLLDSALVNYQRAMALVSPSRSNDLDIALHIEQCKYAKQLLATGQKNKRSHIVGDVNSGFNDYAPVLSHDGKTLYFTSRRSDTKGGRTNPDDQEFFEDTYRARWDSGAQKWDSVTNEIDRINSDVFAISSLRKVASSYDILKSN